MTAILGVDPTATGTGAAVLRVDGQVAAWWVWTLVRDGWRTKGAALGKYENHMRTATAWFRHDAPLDSLDYVGQYVSECAWGLAHPGRVSLVVEGLFVPPRWAKGASGADVIKLAEATGRTIAGLARYCGEPVARPTWKEWGAPFGLSTGTAKACERAVVARAMAEGWLPHGLTAAEDVSVGECGVISRWGES
jgi:hypothetical protein